MQSPEILLLMGQRSSSPSVEESETAIGGVARIHSDVSGSRHNRHVRHAFREGLAEVKLNFCLHLLSFSTIMSKCCTIF